jgi:hypothetical protein
VTSLATLTALTALDMALAVLTAFAVPHGKMLGPADQGNKKSAAT